MLNKLFSEDSDISIMRIMSLLCTVTGIGIAVLGIIYKCDLMGIAAIVGVFVGSAFAGKTLQKGHEIAERLNKKEE